MIWPYFLLVVTILRSVASQNLNEAVLEDGANGTAVVLLSVVHIQQAAIFPDDNELLRRIAYVETRDGVSGTTNTCGIWAVSEEAFARTKDSRNIFLQLKVAQISQSFGIEWRDVELSDLRKPFYSALAARLILFLVPRAIPSKTDIVTQAQFWKENYRYGNGSLGEFIRAANDLFTRGEQYTRSSNNIITQMQAT